jgi:probable HAF family extracellular repeat protein
MGHTFRRVIVGPCALVVPCAVAADALAQASFQVIPVPEGSVILLPGAMSADGGRVALRAVQASGDRSLIWSPGGGFINLGQLDATRPSSVPDAISADGSVVVGQASGSGSTARGYRWTAGTGMVDLGAPPPFYTDVFTEDVTPNGNVAVGSLRDVTNFSMGYRWTASTGYQLLGDLPGGPVSSRANAISGNGQVIVGGSLTEGGSHAFRWTQAGGMQGLGAVPGGGSGGQAKAVNHDGTVIAGIDVIGTRVEVFKWTAANGFTVLGNELSGSNVSDMTPDGTKTVGTMGGRAVYWDALNVRHDFQNELASLGLSAQLQGWNLGYITDVSDSGLVYVGQGTDPSGKLQMWMASIPEPLVCGWIVALAAVARGPRKARTACNGRC